MIVHEIGQINGLLAFMIFEGTSMLFWGLKYNSSHPLYACTLIYLILCLNTKMCITFCSFDFHYETSRSVSMGNVDAVELILDLLAHERNGYRRFLSTDIKRYLSRIMVRYIQ